jgi:putative two-component system response regulator
VFDALTMVRPYKNAWSITDAVDEIKRGRGQHFDPHLVDRFLSILEEIRDIKHHWDEREE